MSSQYDFDFAVAGGGPAGSSAAIALALAGHSVVLFERENFPRFHIGESLLPTANDAFAILGITDQIAAAGFPVKWGAILLTSDGKSGRGIEFANVREITRPQTYQVCREVFDRILLDRARSAGAEVRECHRVTSCDFTADAATLQFTDASGNPGSVRVQALVDATGQHGLVARKLGLRRDEPMLANIAIFAHYKGIPPLPGDRSGDIRLVARADAGWFWLIPVSTEIVSVGVVLPKSLFLSLPEGTNEERLAATIADTPAMVALMKDATREWPVRVEKDFSYSASRYAGSRWILTGDAGSFLDPVFSTGVSVAMESGIEAAHALSGALRDGDFSEKRFRSFTRRQLARYRAFRRFVVAFYTPEFKDIFFDPEPPERIFRAVGTVLSGNWHPKLWTRFLNRVFFTFVGIQRRVTITKRLFRRDASAGYPVR